MASIHEITHPPGDADEDWTNIDDFAERRRVQNRIAQRNYRRKLRGRLADLENRGTASAANGLTEDRNIHDSRFHTKSKPGFIAPFAAIKHTTISRDHTRGELSRQSALLAHFGRTTTKFQSQKEDDQNTEESPAAQQRPTSYWSLSESAIFPDLLRSLGTDWSAIAARMGTKTDVMVENYFLRQRNQGKIEWETIAAEADARRKIDETYLGRSRRNRDGFRPFNTGNPGLAGLS